MYYGRSVVLRSDKIYNHDAFFGKAINGFECTWELGDTEELLWVLSAIRRLLFILGILGTNE